MKEGEKYIYHYVICPNCCKKIEIEKHLSGYHSTVPPEEAEEAF